MTPKRSKRPSRRSVRPRVLGNLEDMPYFYVGRLGRTDVVIEYGRTGLYERWRLWSARGVSKINYCIRIHGRLYRYYGRIFVKRGTPIDAWGTRADIAGGL
jgi:hypothetical protein